MWIYYGTFCLSYIISVSPDYWLCLLTLCFPFPVSKDSFFFIYSYKITWKALFLAITRPKEKQTKVLNHLFFCSQNCLLSTSSQCANLRQVFRINVNKDWCICWWQEIQLLCIHIFQQSNQPSTRVEISGPDLIVLPATHRKYCSHLLYILHHLWHPGSSGKLRSNLDFIILIYDIFLLTIVKFISYMYYFHIADSWIHFM